MKAVAFDLDGTLADTAPDLIAAANAVCAAFGWPRLSVAADRLTAGQGARALLRRSMARAGLPPDEGAVDRLVGPYLEDYGARIARETTLYPGAQACLDALAADGWRLGVCTNKPERLAVSLLDALGIGSRFAAVLGADTLPVRKPDPEHLRETLRRIGADPARAVLVGDTVTDRETARAAGVPCILCRFGYAAQPLAQLAADAEVDALAEVPATAARLIGAPLTRPAGRH